jgi:hypothetical protein
MSDVTVAPPSAPNPAPQPQTAEVPINQNPVNAPNPIGSQAPQAPVGDLKGSEHRPQSRREAIQAAFDRANNPQRAARPAEKPTPKAAEAKSGHNQPPEETEKFDLKKRPSDLPRGDRGQFAPRTQDAPQMRTQMRDGADNAKGMNGTQQEGSTHTLPENSPFREPPPRMAEHAKKDWANTPDSVRGEVGRMHHEFNRAYEFYRADHEAFKPLRGFHELAQRQGTTLAKAVNNYVTMEQKLRADPIGGLDLIIHNLGMTDPATGKQIDLRDVAYHVLSRSPEQLRQVQQGNQQQAAGQQIGALHQEIQGLKSHLAQMHTVQQFHQTRSAVDQFADSHPRFDELGDLIQNEINLGFDLETAYRRAELLRPGTHAAQTRNPSAQTRTTDRSISGAPSDVTASNAASRRPREASRSPREAVQRAIAANGRL